MPLAGVAKRRRVRTSAGRPVTARTQNIYDKLTSEYGSPMVVTGLSAPLATRGFYGQYTRRGREELKVIENTSTTATVSSTGALSLVNGVSQGTDFTNRIGRKITMKSLLARFFIQPLSSASANVGDVVRVMMIYDTQPNSSGSLPAVTDILTSFDVVSGINLNNRDRFKVILDKKVSMNPGVYTAGALSAGSPQVKYIDKYRKFTLDTIFSGTAATIGSISSGSLFWLYLSNSNGSNQITFYSRVRFQDA